VGHASRVYLSWERDVPLPIPELVARPIASARDRRRSWGSSYPSQCCSCPPGFGSSSDPHDPLAVFRTSPRIIFVGGSAVLYTVQISSFVTHNCERQPITDVRRGFWVFNSCAGNPFRSISLDRAGRDCRGLCPLSGVPARRISRRCSCGLEVPRGPSAAGNPLPAPIRS
jgi:hypothetical protein